MFGLKVRGCVADTERWRFSLLMSDCEVKEVVSHWKPNLPGRALTVVGGGTEICL